MHSLNDITLEICCDSVEGSLAAQQAGASRLELCSALVEGGLTPPMSLMEKVCQSLKIPVHMMIRPRGGDFLYSNEEYHLMQRDIEHAAAAGAAGVVFGVLQSDGSIDRARCKKLIALAAPMQVTFHRAFDMTADPFLALEEVIALGCHTLLTSGHRQTAEDGLELIRELVKRNVGRIEIMAGGGVSPANIILLYEAGVRAFHFTARKPADGRMQYRNPSLVSMGRQLQVDEYRDFEFDEEKVRSVIKILRSA